MPETPPKSPDSSGAARKAIGAGRSGPVRVAVRRALAEAREARRMTLEHEVRAVLAERYAALVDDAVRAGDGVRLVSAGGKLTELLDTLPIRATGSEGGASSGDGGSDRAQLHAIMGGPPEVGDAADG